MNYDLTEEQVAMEQMAKNFAEKEVVPQIIVGGDVAPASGACVAPYPVGQELQLTQRPRGALFQPG
jgi:hypothetical protein